MKTKESIAALFDAFIADLESPNPLGEQKIKPGRYIESIDEISLMDLVSSYIIIEPWPHVGLRPSDQAPVIGSENMAWLINRITGCDVYILPAWKTGIKKAEEFAVRSKLSLGTIFEGGQPNVHEEKTFAELFSRKDATSLLIEMMLIGSPFLCICLSHQLAAYAHVALIKQMTQKCLEASSCIDAFAKVAERIRDTAKTIQVRKGGAIVAAGWDHEMFAVGPNEEVSCCDKPLYPYRCQGLEHIDTELIQTHQMIAHLHTSTIDETLRHAHVRVQAFHGNEVSEECMHFVCWAYQQLHRVAMAYRFEVASNDLLHPLLSIPLAVEITSSTRRGDGITTLCEVASTAIYWQRRMAQTTQFHPELDENLMIVSEGWCPSWQQLKQSPAIRLLAKLLRGLISYSSI